MQRVRRSIVATVGLLIAVVLGSASPASASTWISWDDFSRTETGCWYECNEQWTVCTYCDNSGCWNEPCAYCEWCYRCETYRVELPDGDLIDVKIERNAVPADGVVFVLESGPNVSWWKGLRIPDGEGSSWEITTEGSRKRAEESLWAHQVHNGQALTFSKAKWFGWHTEVYQLGGLERLAPGTRVTFRWVQD